ncbi:MAG: S1 RNA-binding domain-containing protein [Tissierellia bacterium]|nr:S1 RNA-binding domain-containing protein [Tissierellia bacterium]
MPIAIGDIVEGKVSGVTKFGAFVALPEGKSGLVHISEISKDYVERVEDYLKKNDQVKVKVLTIGSDGKIGLSIRQAEPKQKEKRIIKQPSEVSFGAPKAELSFEDMMSRFLKDSNDRIDEIRSRDGKRKVGQR